MSSPLRRLRTIDVPEVPTRKQAPDDLDQLEQPLSVAGRRGLVLVPEIRVDLVSRQDEQADPIGPFGELGVLVRWVAETEEAKRRGRLEIVDANRVRRQVALDSLPRAVAEVEGDLKAWVERPEQQGEQPFVPFGSNHRADRTEPVAEPANPLFERRQVARTVGVELRREAESGRGLLRPALELA